MNRRNVMLVAMMIALFAVILSCTIDVNDQAAESEDQHLIERVELESGGYIDFVSIDDEILAVAGLFKELPANVSFDIPPAELYETITSKDAPEKLLKLTQEINFPDQDKIFDLQSRQSSQVNSRAPFYTGQLSKSAFKRHYCYDEIENRPFWASLREWFDEYEPGSTISSNTFRVYSFAHCYTANRINHKIRYKKGRKWKTAISQYVDKGYSSVLKTWTSGLKRRRKFQVIVTDISGGTDRRHHCSSIFYRED